MLRYLVLAANKQQAQFYAGTAVLRLMPAEWRYVAGPQDLYGADHDDVSLLVVGNYSHHPHCGDILRQARERGLSAYRLDSMVL